MRPIGTFNLRSFFVRGPCGVPAGETFYVENSFLQSAPGPLRRAVAGIQWVWLPLLEAGGHAAVPLRDLAEWAISAFIFTAPLASALFYINVVSTGRRGARPILGAGRLLLVTTAACWAWNLAAQAGMPTAPAGAATMFLAGASFVWFSAGGMRLEGSRPSAAPAALLAFAGALLAAAYIIFAVSVWWVWRGELSIAASWLLAFRRCAGLSILVIAVGEAVRHLSASARPVLAALARAAWRPLGSLAARVWRPSPRARHLAAAAPAAAFGSTMIKNLEGQPYLEKFDSDLVMRFVRDNKNVPLDHIYIRVWKTVGDVQAHWREYLWLLAAIQHRGEAASFSKMAADDPVYRALCSTSWWEKALPHMGVIRGLPFVGLYGGPQASEITDMLEDGELRGFAVEGITIIRDGTRAAIRASHKALEPFDWKAPMEEPVAAAIAATTAPAECFGTAMLAALMKTLGVGG